MFAATCFGPIGPSSWSLCWKLSISSLRMIQMDRNM